MSDDLFSLDQYCSCNNKRAKRLESLSLRMLSVIVLLLLRLHCRIDIIR